MDSNLSLAVGFKGQLNLNAQAVPMQEGYLKIGGIVDAGQTDGLKFGVVCSADPTAPSQFKAGVVSGNVFRGIVVFDDAIAQNAPAHPDYYLPQTPCAAVLKGLVRFDSWTTTGTKAIEPVIGCKAEYNTTTGVIEFIASGSSADTGCAIIDNASVVEVTGQGAFLYLA